MPEHVWVTDRQRTVRFRDVRILRCTLCQKTARVCMRSMRPLDDKIADLKLPPCEGKPTQENLAALSDADFEAALRKDPV